LRADLPADKHPRLDAAVKEIDSHLFGYRGSRGPSACQGLTLACTLEAPLNGGAVLFAGLPLVLIRIQKNVHILDHAGMLASTITLRSSQFASCQRLNEISNNNSQTFVFFLPIIGLFIHLLLDETHLLIYFFIIYQYFDDNRQKLMTKSQGS
jgi:hypothetical protein